MFVDQVRPEGAGPRPRLSEATPETSCSVIPACRFAHAGCSLRRDIHNLFDAGYVTVMPDLRFEVSRRIKEEFENERHYYELQGKPIAAPTDALRRPDPRGAALAQRTFLWVTEIAGTVHITFSARVAQVNEATLATLSLSHPRLQ